MHSEESRKTMLKAYLQVIFIISDEEYQRRAWIYGEPFGIDFDEICCLFFSDNGDIVLENYKDFGITDNQYKVLKPFRDKFAVFSDDKSYEPEFIDTPEWKEIRSEAKEVLQSFNFKGTYAYKRQFNL